MDFFAGGVGCVRARPSRWEGECGSHTDTKEDSKAQGEEGKCRPAVAGYFLSAADSLLLQGFRLVKFLPLQCSPIHCHYMFLFAIVATGSRSSCGAGRRSGLLHAAPLPACTHRIEATEEGTEMQGARRSGGSYSDTSEVLAVEEGDRIGHWIGGSGAPAADTHAGERCGKRLRSSTP